MDYTVIIWSGQKIKIMKDIKLLLKILGSVSVFVVWLLMMTYSLKMISAKSDIESWLGIIFLIILISSIMMICIKAINKLINHNPKTNEKIN
jgi:hypothetical protein